MKIEPPITAAELAPRRRGLGLDVVGAAPAAPYEDTERHIRERRERGLFGGMRFTMAQPEVSCHPETLLDGRADGRLGGALLLRRRPRARDRGGPLAAVRVARPLRRLLRARLDALGRRLGGAYRVLVDANQHVDRAGAERAGVGFIGKNTMLITRTHGSWVVLGTLVTDVELEPTPPVAPGCGSCTLCIDACPTDALDEPGVLDADAMPGVLDADARRHARRRHGGARGPRVRLRHLPGRVPLEPGRREAPRRTCPSPTTRARPSRSWTGSTRDGDALIEELDRLYVPRNDPRWLRRNALVALGNVGAGARRAAGGGVRGRPDPALAAAAGRAVAAIEQRAG